MATSTPPPSLASLACGPELAREQRLHNDFPWLGGTPLCDRPGLARMPLAAQLFLARGDTGLRAGWGQECTVLRKLGGGGPG